MREIIAVCRSEKRSRDRVARVLDRYFWRIGDRTWRGKATNACLDRVARELRKRATRNTAVVLHEIRSSLESRKPIIRIGARHAFSEEGVVPISSHPADYKRGAAIREAASSSAAAVGIAALFHDLGKATTLFQAKLCRALKDATPKAEADAVRHELFSAAVWDDLFGDTEDTNLVDALGNLTTDGIDESCRKVRQFLKRIHMQPEDPVKFRFIQKEGSLFHLIGMLILTHHRLPAGEADHLTLLGDRHVRDKSPLNRDIDLAIASGTPFWHEGWWLEALRTEAGRLKSDVIPASGDIALRASLMFADHLGSAKKTPNGTAPDHLANTTTVKGMNGSVPADSLSRHVKRVYRYSRFAHEMTYALRDRYPALDEPALPTGIAFPEPSPSPRFAWQGRAARAVRTMCEKREGGFFAAILAGTGTGKTRGAPTILAGAAMGDSIPERRYLRMSLGLGLRVLATQSAKEYVEDLGFATGDISVLVGDPPLDFREPTVDDEPTGSREGSESIVSLPEWLRVEDPEGCVPVEGDEREERWLKGLSLDTDRGLPAFLDLVLEKAGKHAGAGRRLLQAPIMVGTIDHLMGVAAPVNSRFLLQSLRLMTSDLILDEIDQYDGEDLAAIGRLIFQAGAAGRRVIIMSATLTPDIAEALHLAYSRGWADHAKASGTSSHVNLLLCGDAPGAVFTNMENASLSALLDQCRASILAGIRTAPALRRGEVIHACDGWAELVDQIDQGCSRLHDLNAVEIEEYRVSVGLVRMTRISHTSALAVNMRSGNIDGRLRVLVCLHSQLPRLHRGYIETRLKRALTRKTRKGINPEAGVLALCQDEGVFEKAREIGTREIEIVVVATPVIETGNDVDFDWAILDPISTRSIIQSAGRVRRHRLAIGEQPNVLILGRSPIAMEGGKLAMPGVETKLADETKVAKVEHLLKYEGRHFVDLAGETDFQVISAEPLLSDDTAFPLREAETHLRKKMLSTDEQDPLGRYILHQNARWNLTMTRTRRFRRSETREVLFTKIGDRPEDAGWFLDLAPGTRDSALREAGAMLHTNDPYEVNCLFENMTARGWLELSGGVSEMTSKDIRELLRVSVPIYGDDLKKEMTYTEFTGFTRGKPEDLLEAFGKSK